MTGQPVLFIANKTDAVKDPKYVLISFQEIERWAQTLTAGGFYASLTGPGETASPGDLTQEGGLTINIGAGDPNGFTVTDTSTDGIAMNTNGGVQIGDNSTFGVSLTESGSSGAVIRTGTGALVVETITGGKIQILTSPVFGGVIEINSAGFLQLYGQIQTAPVPSNVPTPTFSGFAIGTAQQNTFVTDLLVTVSIPVTASAGGQIYSAVAATTGTLASGPVTAPIPGPQVVTFSQWVPANYYLLVTTFGTITAGTPVVQACSV